MGNWEGEIRKSSNDISRVEVIKREPHRSFGNGGNGGFYQLYYQESSFRIKKWGHYQYAGAQSNCWPKQMDALGGASHQSLKGKLKNRSATNNQR